MDAFYEQPSGEQIFHFIWRIQCYMKDTNKYFSVMLIIAGQPVPVGAFSLDVTADMGRIICN